MEKLFFFFTVYYKSRRSWRTIPTRYDLEPSSRSSHNSHVLDIRFGLVVICYSYGAGRDLLHLRGASRMVFVRRYHRSGQIISNGHEKHVVMCGEGGEVW